VVVEQKRIFYEKKIILDVLYRPVAAKPIVLEDFVLGMGTSVAYALTAETIFEIIKCIADVDMLPRGRMGSKCEIFRFFSILATPTMEIFRFVDVGHSFKQETR